MQIDIRDGCGQVQPPLASESMTHSSSNPHTTKTVNDRAAPQRHVMGLPFPAIVGLALLGAPRVVLHDLGVIHEGTGVNMMFVVVPVVLWLAAVLWKRVHNPFVTMLAIGGTYGVILALTHQLLWNVAYGDAPPRLGGNLAGVDPVAQEIIIRTFAGFSGIATGLLTGAVLGLVAWALSSLLRRR